LGKSIDNYIAETPDDQAKHKNHKRFEHRAFLKGRSPVNFAHGAIFSAYACSSISVKLVLPLYSLAFRANKKSKHKNSKAAALSTAALGITPRHNRVKEFTLWAGRSLSD
jgi:hypothetical protein